MAKILYLPCHEILESLEVSLFHELGYQVFSPGSYVCPENRGDQGLRPNIPGLTSNSSILEQYHRLSQAFPGQDGKDHLTREFVDNFDIVVVMHMPRWIENNWEVMKHKRVIWRTIGQSIAPTETSMQKYVKQGLQVVRYSPNEANIPGFCGQTAFIRFYIDEKEFAGWNGNTNQVITFAQDMQRRGTHCNYSFFEEVTRPFPRKLFGPGNNQPGFGMGKVSYARLKEELRNNRVYFYTGTHPASYTLNFIESWMTGIPLVCISSQHGNADIWRDHNLYEIPSLIQHGVNGFISDNIKELRSCITQLMNDKKLAKSISTAGRDEAIRHFGKEMIKNAWKDFLEK